MWYPKFLCWSWEKGHSLFLYFFEGFWPNLIRGIVPSNILARKDEPLDDFHYVQDVAEVLYSHICTHERICSLLLQCESTLHCQRVNVVKLLWKDILLNTRQLPPEALNVSQKRLMVL